MQDVGTFNLIWSHQETGTCIVRCRELPDFRISVAAGQDFTERVASSLRHYLSWRYGVNAEVAHEADAAHFRCRIAA